MAEGLTLHLDDQMARRLLERAQREGVTVEEEARRLLDQALGSGWGPFWSRVDQIRQSLAGRSFSDSADLIREDRDR
ncbi:MAG TPA: hypothetical protein VE685_05030 [Thermoanaerobaculia bacterium]|nr:hypothetical protein [Thermoanaerobaculia bacterium]